MVDIKELKFNQQGLIPAVIQDYSNGKVLMVGYMNEKSLKLTIETRKTWFYSRSRQKLWNKGETSGNFQEVKTIKYDCDKDTLLIEVIPKGPACHTGEESCFYRSLLEDESSDDVNRKEILDLLYDRIRGRKEENVQESYTKYLFDKGIDKILKKVGEEASEVIIGAKNDNEEEIIYEISDLIYHLMVLLIEKNISLDAIRNELYKRYKK
ncbi:MAG: phosphoribosyl-AMP cyclohydrolase / phosphoribosyl-ATP pyrophosphohydrolase [Candidatus Petromonas sp.]|jgi:phosphoribosyl-ATP pyrophosphohydrolase/phosphoribosyl-AMP cyclohydrolase|nr:phosphoribosyl-AMP cyclohydrolase / phosphoribosyl-ATP pyrophosphohydrolase [Candidatus Petromonas sp.]